MRNAGSGVAEGTIDFLTNTNTFDVLSLKRFNFYTSLANFDNLALSKLPVCRIIDLLVHPKEKIMKKHQHQQQQQQQQKQQKNENDNNSNNNMYNKQQQKTTSTTTTALKTNTAINN